MDVKNKNRIGYKKTKVGWIPGEWSVSVIGQRKHFVTSGSRGWSQYYSDSGALFVRITNLNRNMIDLDYTDCRFVAFPRVGSEGVRTRLQDGDVLISITADLGIIGYFASSAAYSDAYVNQHIALLRLLEQDVYSKFVAYQLSGKQAQKRFRRIADQGAKAGLNLSAIRSFPIPLPPLSEQEAIAGVLECWDNAIRNYEKKIEKKRNIKKGLMQRLLSGKQRLPGFSGEWKDVKLGTLGVTYPGLAGKTQHDFGAGKPFIPYMNIYSNSSVCVNALGYVTVEEGERQNKVQYGDLFFTTSSETPEEVGVSSVLLNNMEELYLNSFCFGFRLHNFEILNLEFSQYYFRGADFRKSMFRIAQGASRYNLSKKYFLKTQIRIPGDIEEQKMIARFMSTTDSELEKMEQKLVFLKDQKKYLLNNLVTGTIRLPQFRGGTASNSTDGENI